MDIKSKESRKIHIHKLNELTFQVSADSKIAVVISDTSIKNQVATPIAHIYVHDNSIIKTHHHAIRCGINQATQLININCIIVIMNSIHAAKRIFDLSVHLYQNSVIHNF